MREYSESNPPAFPRDHRHIGHNGMSLRDWFAGQAMAAIISKTPSERIAKSDAVEAEIALGAYTYADAMLATRQEQAA